jgi:hypothetical protein
MNVRLSCVALALGCACGTSTSSGGSDRDGGGIGVDGGGQAGADAGPEYCSNETDCACADPASSNGRIGPFPPDEVGHWAAARIDLPVEGTFRVEELRYGLKNPLPDDPIFDKCFATVPHRVQLVVSSGDAPASTPEPAWETSVAMDDMNSDPVDVVLNVEPPVEVGPTENLFFVLEMAGDPDAFICVVSCVPSPDEAIARSFWSNDRETPFDWVGLDEFGLLGGLDVGVRGRVVSD